MRSILAATALLVCLSLHASAQDHDTRAIFALTDTKCEEWTDRRLRAARFSDASRMESWAFGFLTGVNVAAKDSKSPNLLSNVDQSAIGIWLDDYCRLRPKESFSSGVIALSADLRERALRK